MARAHRHQRLLSALAFGLLALVAELAGRSLTHRIDLGRHVATPSYAGTDYYPILLAVVKGGIALLLARLVCRRVLRVPRPSLVLAAPPRSIFGLAFESRPPPLPA